MKLFKEKEQNKFPKKISEQALLFIKKYAVPERAIQSKIDEDLAGDVLNFNFLYPYSKDEFIAQSYTAKALYKIIFCSLF